MTISVLVADDQSMVRAGFRMLLAGEEDIEVVAEASNGREAVEKTFRYHPAVILMDIRMPELDGLQATRRILAADNGTRVLILTTFDLDEYVYEALRAGASGFLLKDTPPEQLVEAIRIVADGDELLTPSVTCRIVSEFARRTETAPDAADLEELIDDDLELLRSVAAGLSNAEIAERSGLEEATVRERLNRVLAALHLRDRVHAVVFAHEHGLVTADDCEDEPLPP